MTYDPTTVLKAIQNKLASAGRYNQVMIGDPLAPPAALGLAAHITVKSVEGDEVTLGTVSGPLNLMVTLYQSNADPSEAKELEIARAPFDFWADIMGDFDLGVAEVRNVQPDIRADWLYAEIGDVQFRMCEFALGIYINDIVSTVR